MIWVAPGGTDGLSCARWRMRRVIDGYDVLDAIEKSPVGKKNKPLQDIVIKTVTMHANPIADASA
jgi:hypothetical protein